MAEAATSGAGTASGIGGGVAVLVVGAALLLAACGGDAGGAVSAPGRVGLARPAGRATDSITISNFMFSPMAASVAPGATVTRHQPGLGRPHPQRHRRAFDTGDVNPGQTKTFTAPTKPGTLRYICNIHQYMKGTIVVR